MEKTVHEELLVAQRGIRKGLDNGAENRHPRIGCMLGAIQAVINRGYADSVFEIEAIKIGLENSP
jgi:hypothetical protein